MDVARFWLGRRFLGAGLLLTGALAQSPEWAGAQAAMPMVRGPVDESERVTLAGNRHPLAQAAFDRGRLEDGLALGGLYVVLKRPPEREQALRQFLEAVETPGSAEYHRWVSPDEFGDRFGPAESDAAAVEAWLESHGLTVEPARAGRLVLRYSGTAGAVAEAFHTELHRYEAGGRTLVANDREPEIPAALAEVIAGAPLAGVRARPLISVGGRTEYNPRTHAAKAAWTYPPSPPPYLFELGPGDFAVQYGLTSVYGAGTTGAGQSIGVVSDSNVDLGMVQAYRTLFGLPASVPSVVIDGNDPGIDEDATETYLDMEEAGAVAPGAQVILYTSAGTLLEDPLQAAALRAVEDNQVGVLSVSYTACEASLGVAGNALWAGLWQEAAAQGISVFVAAGDSGSAGCDDFEAEGFAETGLAVNGLGSTPYNIAVGGTDFYYSSYAAGGSTLAAQVAGYWSTTASASPAVSLLQPAPEQVWNDPFGLNAADGGLYALANSSIEAGGGGASSAALLTATGAPAGYAKPAWQFGTGVPADGVRDVPDLALFAGNGANYVYYPICALPGDCAGAGSSGAVTLTSVGGTSAAAPAMAAIQALVDQAMKGRQGQAAVNYYALATKFAAAAVKPFNDVKAGGNQVPCLTGTLNCTLSASGQTKGFYAENNYLAGAGYDRASGLGSVNVAALIADWPNYTFRPTATTLTVTPSTLAHGMPATLTMTVVPKSGTGTPTGSVALVSNGTQAYASGLDAAPLTGGTSTVRVDDLPGGTYQLTAEYSGDAAYAASSSAPVTVTVTAEKNTLATSGWVLTPLDGSLYPLTTGLSIPYGSEVTFDAQPVGVNEAASVLTQNAPATGAVVFTDKLAASSRVATVPLNGMGLAEWIPGAGAIGAHSVSASYAGDGSYAASATAAAIGYTVFKGTTTLSVRPLETSVSAGGSVTVDVELAAGYLPLVGALPTGGVTVTLGNKAQTATWSSWGTLGSAVQETVVTFTGLPAGILPLSASYAGDANWNGSSGIYGSITALSAKATPAMTLTSSAAAYTPGQTVTMTGTVTGPAGGAAPSGSLIFSWEDGGASATGTLTAIAANASAYTLTLPAYMLANGTNLFVASFAGDGNYAAQSSPPLAITLNGSDFSAVATTQEVAAAYGTKATGTIVIAPINGFTSPVTASCAAPAGISCVPAYTTITVGGGFADPVGITISGTMAAGTYPVTVTLSGGGHTHAVEILVAATPPAATPVFTPVAGMYTTAQTVTISDTTPGATIYYTTNGTTPTTASALYTGAIAVTATETIKAIATAPGYVASAAVAATYTITPPAAMPAFSPPAGTYTATQTVTISDSTPGAAIYYTTNGTAPTTASSLYTGAISVAANETLMAAAIAPGYSLSATAKATYVIAQQAATPAFSPAAGTYSATQMVAIGDATAGATIYYTTNGTTPTTASAKYTTPISVAATETLEAIAVATGYTQSATATAAYTITTAAVAPTQGHLPKPGSPLPKR